MYVVFFLLVYRGALKTTPRTKSTVKYAGETGQRSRFRSLHRVTVFRRRPLYTAGFVSSEAGPSALESTSGSKRQQPGFQRAVFLNGKK
jgi:hypothetical protein